MKRFLLGILFGFALSALALVVLFFVAIKIGQKRPSVAADSLLVLRLEGSLPEAAPVEIPIPFVQGSRSATVAEMWGLLRRAATDSRIKAVIVMPQGVRGGWGKLTELREDLLAVRKAGKPVYAYLRAPGSREYYLATAAERVYMGPEDFLDVKGLRAELMYFKNTLDKLGVQMDIEHAGKYKDAGDIFTRTDPSPETREVMNSVLDGLYGEIVQAIASGRKQTTDQVRATIDKGPFVARQAKESGLVDDLLYQDQMWDELKGRFKLSEIRKISHIDYLKSLPEPEGGRRIALIAADGDIIRGSGSGSPFEEQEISGATFPKLLRDVGNDNTIKGAIVRIDSPGGDAFASDEIWREMNLLSKKKPIVISMSDLAASGGYYMAMSGDPIVAYPGTLTGSIGVVYGKANLKGLYDKLGIQKSLITRGRFADIDSDYTPLTEAARQKLRVSIDEVYRSFVSKVATARKRDYAQIDALAQGRVWLGMQAKQNGLIDELGGLDRAIEVLKKKAGMKPTDRVSLVPYPPRRSLLDRLFARRMETLLDSRMTELIRRLSHSTWMDGGLLKVLPYTITIQ